MKQITLYRNDFKVKAESKYNILFEQILNDLGIPQNKWDDVDEIELDIEEFICKADVIPFD